MKKTILVFSLLILGLLLLFKLSAYTLYSGETYVEIALGILALVFFVIGLRIKKNTTSPSTPPGNYKSLKDIKLSDREYEVLTGIAEGLSNKEIAERLFLSESTIKTHVSSLLVKLNAKRRTQALQIAKSLKII